MNRALRKHFRRLRTATRSVRRFAWRLRHESYFRRIARLDRARLAQVRGLREAVYEREDRPLISVTTATYNRGDLLVSRTLPSVLDQTYENLEVVVVGDHCTDDTEELVSGIRDPRLRFYNLPERPQYPKDPAKLWRIAGLWAIRLAHDMTRGTWIAHLDDDEVFTPDHIERLLRCAQDGYFEFVSARAKSESRPGVWVEKGQALSRNSVFFSDPVGPVAHSTILWRSYLRVVEYESFCLEVGLNGDSHRMRRLFNAGVRVGFVNDVVTLRPLRPGQKRRLATVDPDVAESARSRSSKDSSRLRK
jgi:glycosyltransferase involved in cell wall biosynthesis